MIWTALERAGFNVIDGGVQPERIRRCTENLNMEYASFVRFPDGLYYQVIVIPVTPQEAGVL